jgi:hypothetical protein
MRRRLRTKKQLAAFAKKLARDSFRTRHSVEVFYLGLDRTKDYAITKAAGRVLESSGMWLTVGLRDLHFEFKTEKSALAAVRRIKKAVPRVRCMLHSSKKV